MKRYTLALDLKDDPILIEKYKEYHKNVWPAVETNILNTGIESLEIYLVSNRLFMILEVNESFSFEKKSTMDLNNPKVQEWETLMWDYQQALPIAKPGEKWILMKKIYEVNSKSK